MKKELAVAIVALVVAGCGGGDEPESGGGESEPDAAAGKNEASKEPSEGKSKTARFIGKADEICARFNDEWVGVPEASAEYYRDWKQSNEDLEALDVPARISTEWDRYLDALEEQRRFTEAEKGLELKQAYEQKEKAAQEIGLTDCSSR